LKINIEGVKEASRITRWPPIKSPFYTRTRTKHSRNWLMRWPSSLRLTRMCMQRKKNGKRFFNQSDAGENGWLIPGF